MKDELLYFVLYSENMDHLMQVFSITQIAPKDNELEDLWGKLNLKVYGDFGSDLIEVYTSTQMLEAFCIDSKTLSIGDVLTPNRQSKEDAINAYFSLI